MRVEQPNQVNRLLAIPNKQGNSSFWDVPNAYGHENYSILLLMKRRPMLKVQQKLV